MRGVMAALEDSTRNNTGPTHTNCTELAAQIATQHTQVSLPETHWNRRQLLCCTTQCAFQHDVQNNRTTHNVLCRESKLTKRSPA
jgi:hypothetical protein